MPATVRREKPLLTGRRTPAKLDLRTVLLAGIVAATALLALRAVQIYGRTYVFFDMRIYHGAIDWWAHGGALYEYVQPNTTLGFTYPPFAAILMLPMVLTSATVAGWINLIAGLAALAVLLRWLLLPLADRYGWPRWFAVALAVPLAAATEPIRETLGFGQVNLLLAIMIFADLVSLRHRHRTARDPGALPAGGLARLWYSGALTGVGVGLATAVKLTPAVFILYFAVTRQWRAVFTAAATTLAVTAGTFVVAGEESVQYFTSVLWDTSRVGAVDATPNQSLAGLLARLYDSPTTPRLMWLAFAMLLLTVGMSRAGNAHQEGDELAAFTIVGLTGNAICPISWTHHLVFVVPAVVILTDVALRRRRAARALATRGRLGRGALGRGVPGLAWMAGLRHASAAVGLYLLFVVSPIWRYEHKLPAVSHWADGAWGALGENSLALAIIVLVVVLPWRTGAEPAFYPERTLRAVRREAVQAINQHIPSRVAPVSPPPVPVSPAPVTPAAGTAQPADGAPVKDC